MRVEGGSWKTGFSRIGGPLLELLCSLITGICGTIERSWGSRLVAALILWVMAFGFWGLGVNAAGRLSFGKELK